jgi:hypothetical protein
LVRSATAGAGRLFRLGDVYRKAWVLLPDVIPVDQVQGDLFAQTQGDAPRSRGRMAVLDTVNQQYGRGTLRYAGQLGPIGGGGLSAGRGLRRRDGWGCRW